MDITCPGHTASMYLELGLDFEAPTPNLPCSTALHRAPSARAYCGANTSGPGVRTPQGLFLWNKGFKLRTAKTSDGVDQLKPLDTASRPVGWKTGYKEGTTGEERETPAWTGALSKALQTGLHGRCGSVHPSPSVSIWPSHCSEMKGGCFPGDSLVKNLPANAGDTGLIPDPGRSHMPQSN